MTARILAVTCAFGALLLLACGEARPATEWHVRGATPEVLRQVSRARLGDVVEPGTSIAWFGADTIVLADLRSPALWFMSVRTGALRSEGRQGDGPGELRAPIAVLAYGANKDSLAVLDIGRRTLMLLGPDRRTPRELVLPMLPFGFAGIVGDTVVCLGRIFGRGGSGSVLVHVVRGGGMRVVRVDTLPGHEAYGITDRSRAQEQFGATMLEGAPVVLSPFALAVWSLGQQPTRLRSAAVNPLRFSSREIALRKEELVKMFARAGGGGPQSAAAIDSQASLMRRQLRPPVRPWSAAVRGREVWLAMEALLDADSSQLVRLSPDGMPGMVRVAGHASALAWNDSRLAVLGSASGTFFLTVYHLETRR